MRVKLLGLCCGLLAMVLTVLAACPAAWMAVLIERQTEGRLTLGDPQGSLWSGSAFLGGAPGPKDPVSPIVPGRFSWHLSPLLMLGQVHLTLENADVLAAPVRLDGNWSDLNVGQGGLMLPADRLASLGAPLNTVRPTGRLRMHWGEIKIRRQGAVVALNGKLDAELSEVASRLSPIRPLGAYRLDFDLAGSSAGLKVTTLTGPLMLAGDGQLQQGRLQFSGTAQAEPGQEEKLANLLSLLGQKRRVGDKDVIALEFN